MPRLVVESIFSLGTHVGVLSEPCHVTTSCDHVTCPPYRRTAPHTWIRQHRPQPCTETSDRGRLGQAYTTCMEVNNPIRDFRDDATFREKGAKLACADKLGVFLSLTLCNKANFDPVQRVKYDGPEKM